MWRKLCYFSLCIGIVSANSFYNPTGYKTKRNPAEETIFRDHVSPETGGKVPEAAHMRVELNKLDSMGFRRDEAAAEAMVEQFRDMSLPDKMPENYSPHSHHSAPAHLHGHLQDPYEQPHHYAKPEPYHPPATEGYFATPGPYSPPEPAYHEPEPYHPPGYHEPSAPYAPPKPEYHEPAYHEPAYHEPAYHEPAPYSPPEPAYGPPAHHDSYAPPHDSYGPPKPYKPKGPVMLEKRPYEPKEIKPVTITTHDTYTAFDCRKVPYPDRHYADPEAGCSIYHFCHADGKQDTFHCAYGTVFNEYLGTCDHSGAVYCKGGEGYAGPPPKPHHPEPYHEPHHVTVHHDSHHVPHHEPHHVPHHEPAYHHPEPAYHQEPHYGGFEFPKGFGSGF